ncbi:MAG: hypothetical protein HXY34_08455 [Candidatus Thorarchaeota archaeon]|nr:hypothetical protein [Candidatus Thorarchaeota archaeon]
MTTLPLGNLVRTSPFWVYFRSSRLLKAALVFNVAYYVAVVLLFLFHLGTGGIESTILMLDFQVFYAAGQMIRVSPADLYTVSPNGLPYRYFPLFGMIMSLFVSFPVEVLYILDISLMMVCNCGTVYMAFHVCLTYGVSVETKNFEKSLTVLSIAPPHIVNLVLGQISQLVVLMALVVLFLLRTMKTDRLLPHFWVGLLVGLVSSMKPFMLLLVPFLIPLSHPVRSTLRRQLVPLAGTTAGLSTALAPSVLFFLMWPTSVTDFLEVNFVHYLDGHHSTSITSLVIHLLPQLAEAYPRFLLSLALGVLIFAKSFSRFIMTPAGEKDYLSHFSDMMFLVLLVYSDSWFLFLAIWYSFLAPSMLLLYQRCVFLSDATKRLDLLWSGANNLLAFFSIGVVLHYLILGFDPVIPVWLTILYLLYQSLLKTKRNAASVESCAPPGSSSNSGPLTEVYSSVDCERLS